MPSSAVHFADDYAERIHERLPHRLQELRETTDLTKHGLSCESGVSRECTGNIQHCGANPTLPLSAKIS